MELKLNEAISKQSILKAMDVSYCGLVIMDDDYTIIEANNVFASMFSYNQRDLSGKSLFFLYNKDKLEQNILSNSKKTNSWQGEITGFTNDSYYAHELSLSYIEGKYICIVHDISKFQARVLGENEE